MQGLAPPKPKRRKGSDLAEHEKWYCPFRCGKFYRKTSTRSIRRHRNECAFHISVRKALSPGSASSPALAGAQLPNGIPRKMNVRSHLNVPARPPSSSPMTPKMSPTITSKSPMSPLPPPMHSFEKPPRSSPCRSPSQKMPIHQALQVFLIKSLQERNATVPTGSASTPFPASVSQIMPPKLDLRSKEEPLPSRSNPRGSPVQHLEKMLPQEQLLKILEKENKWKAADAKLKRRHHSLPRPDVSTGSRRRHSTGSLLAGFDRAKRVKLSSMTRTAPSPQLSAAM